MAEPTLREILDAVNGLGTRLDRVEQRLDALDHKVDALTDMVVNGFAGLSTRSAKPGAAGFPESEVERRVRTR